MGSRPDELKKLKLGDLSPRENSGQRNGSLGPYSRFSRREPLLFFQSSFSVVLTSPSGPRSRPTICVKRAGNRTQTSGSVDKNSGLFKTEGLSVNINLTVIKRSLHQ
jgi:hypothetical protein